jgi:hypothetical protein
MIIANNNIRIDTSYVQEVLSNPNDYDSIKVDININCCTSNCTELVDTYTLPVDAAAPWYINLDTPVKLGNEITRLNIISLKSYHELNVITVPIDLGYIEDNCSTSSCTLETYSVYFTPLFKNQIDAYFLTIGITSNVTVTFDDNILIIDNIPTLFAPSSVEYGVAAPYAKLYFGYGEVSSKAFISGGGLFIQPDFFSTGKFVNGVYKITVTYTKADGAGYIKEETCSFIDIDLACKVAALLKTVHTNKQSTNAHLLHYALVNGSNCGCNCDDLCKVFKELIDLLNSVDPQTLDCGC